ncbi:MAG: hypothetical protein ACREQW_17690 [Candidatus Binatia bacterium]
MANKILVPLKSRDGLDEIVLYLKEVSRPGMSVVFLIRRPVNWFKWLQAYSAVMECGLENAAAIHRMSESYSAEMNRRLAEQGVFRTCQALHQLRVKIAVEVYSGSLRKALKRYVNSGDVELIVTRPWIGFQFMRLVDQTTSVLSIFKRPSSSPWPLA